MVKLKAIGSRSVFILLAFLNIFFNCACALDSPDTTDYLKTLKDNEKVYLSAIDNPNNGSRDYLIAYDDYEKFLDSELNRAYRLIMSRLPAEQKEELKIAQQNWMKYRDAEFMLIKHNWTRGNFGSSAGLSRGSYRCSIIRNRVVQLFNYASNYAN